MAKQDKNIWQKIGTGLGGFAAPFLGDYQWQQRQTQLEQQQAQQVFQNWLMGQMMGIKTIGLGGLSPDLGITGISLGGTTPRITIGQTPESKARQEIETTQEKKAEEVKNEINSINNMVATVFDAANRLIPAPKDIAQAEKLGIKRGAQTTSILGIRPQRLLGWSDEDALAFEQIKKGEATPLIRSLGEKGMLTNQDIQRALELMPGLSDSVKLRKTKQEELGKFLNSKIKAYYKETAFTNEQEDLISQYMKKYQGKNRESIIAAMQKQGIL